MLQILQIIKRVLVACFTTDDPTSNEGDMVAAAVANKDVPVLLTLVKTFGELKRDGYWIVGTTFMDQAMDVALNAVAHNDAIALTLARWIRAHRNEALTDTQRATLITIERGWGLQQDISHGGAS